MPDDLAENPVPAAGATRREPLRWALAFVLATVGFVGLPAIYVAPGLVAESCVWRALVAGLIAGLALARVRDPLAIPAVAAAATVAGCGWLALGGPLGVAPWDVGIFAGIAALAAWFFATVSTFVAPRMAAAVVLVAVIVAFLGCVGALGLGVSARDTGRQLATLGSEAGGTADVATTSAATPHREAYALEFVRSVVPASDPTVWRWFLVACVLGLTGAFALGTEFVEPAAAAAGTSLVAGYLGYFALPGNFLFAFADVWAGVLALLAIAALVRERWVRSAVLVSAAVLCREFALVFAVVWLVAWWWGPDRRRTAWGLVALAGGPALLAVRYVAAPVSNSLRPSRLLFGSLGDFSAAMHSGGELIATWGALALVVPLLALLGASLARPHWRRLALLWAVALPCVLFALFTAGPAEQYWGALALPTFLAMVPLALARVLPAESSRLQPATPAEPPPAETLPPV